MPLLHGLSIRSHGQGFGYSHQALPHIQQFLQEVTPRVEQNRMVERRVISAFNSANYAELEQCFHDDWTCDGQAIRRGSHKG